MQIPIASREETHEFMANRSPGISQEIPGLPSISLFHGWRSCYALFFFFLMEMNPAEKRDIMPMP